MKSLLIPVLTAWALAPADCRPPARETDAIQLGDTPRQAWQRSWAGPTARNSAPNGQVIQLAVTREVYRPAGRQEMQVVFTNGRVSSVEYSKD